MSWKNQKVWSDMKEGINCPFCEDIHLEENAHSFKIAGLEQTYVRLPKNQHWRGWIIVALKRHANELYELTPKELHKFWDEVSFIAKIVSELSAPVKINYAVFGNLCPHLHCHILPQRFESDPHAAIKQNAKELPLTGEEYEKILHDFWDRIRMCT